MTHDMGSLVKVIGKGSRTDKFCDPILDSDQLATITAAPERSFLKVTGRTWHRAAQLCPVIRGQAASQAGSPILP